MAKSALAIPLDQHLCFKLYVASRLVMRGYGERLTPLKLTYPKYLVLLALGEDGDHTVGSLGARLVLDFGTLSPLLKSLVKDKLITQKRHPKDERTVVNALTPKGRTALTQAMGIAFQLYCETGMAYDELVSLRNQMDDYIAKAKGILQ